MHCRGEGHPIVLLEADAGDFSFDWSLVQPDLASTTRVCSYDRAGYAWSDPGPLPRTIRQVVSELHALLVNAGVRPPYVLVGHSLGGLFVRAYATTYPTEVVGLVLVEATHEDNPIMLDGEVVLLRATSRGRGIPTPRLEPPIRDAAVIGTQPPQGAPSTVGSPYDRLPPALHEVRIWASQRASFVVARSSEFDYLAEELSEMHEQRARQSHPLGDLPLVVLTRADAPSGHATRQADLAKLSTSGRHTTAATVDHHVHLTEPDAVIRAIKQVLDAARSGARLSGDRDQCRGRVAVALAAAASPPTPRGCLVGGRSSPASTVSVSFCNTVP